MRIGITMLISAIIALIAGWFMQRNRMVMNWSRMMRRIRWNRLAAALMGRRLMRR